MVDTGSMAALVAGGAAAAAAYLEAKYHVSQDLEGIIAFRRGMKNFEQATKEGRASLFYPFEETCSIYPDHRAIWSRTGSYTFQELLQRSYQYGNYFLSIGIKPGDVVATYLVNSPEFIFVWFGLWAIGCCPSSVNYNLGADPLVHCVKICGSKFLIADPDEACQERVQGVASQINANGTEVVALTAELKAKLASWDNTRPADSLRAGVSEPNAPILIIYTSGTTGLPKAYAFRTSRLYPTMVVRRGVFSKPGPGGDIWYDPMPLYHGTGCLMGLNSLLQGTTLAIGRSFSVRNFWRDVRDSDATMFIYVGETARYLLAAPPSPDDKNHKIRLMYGNGLRPDVWTRFKERFGVEEVVEFFNSTEGMLSTVVRSKNDFAVGAVGHHGLILRTSLRNTYVPVKIDHSTGDIYRSSATGFAQREDYNIGGEILVAMANEAAWPGYWNSKEATNKKLIRDVFKKGDLYYRPGDALRRNDDGLWYFMDRLGDTFRWKGENVSTTEVAETLGKFPGIYEANVYGVQLPNHDGRAGCAAVAFDSGVDPSSFDWRGLAKYGRANLPRYAVPIFVRLATSAMNTHNNKQDKVKLRTEGVDPELRGTKVAGGQSDRIYWLHPKADAYVPFTEQEWAAFGKGTVSV